MHKHIHMKRLLSADPQTSCSLQWLSWTPVSIQQKLTGLVSLQYLVQTYGHLHICLPSCMFLSPANLVCVHLRSHTDTLAQHVHTLFSLVAGTTQRSSNLWCDSSDSKPPCTHIHAEQGAPHPGWWLEMKFNEETGQSALIWTRTWPDKHGQTSKLFRSDLPLYPIVFKCLFLPKPDRYCPFNFFNSSPKHPIRSLLSSSTHGVGVIILAHKAEVLLGQPWSRNGFSV